MADSACYIELASNNGDFFTNSVVDDIMIRPQYPTQKILLGTSNGQIPSIAVTSNNVGIGTASPSYKLDVGGDINFTGTLLQNGTEWTASQWSNSSANVFLLGSNVGIGTSSPTYKLDIAGGMNITNVGNAQHLQLSNNNSPYIKIHGSNGVFAAGVASVNGAHSSDSVAGDVILKTLPPGTTGRMLLQTGSGSSAMCINSNNNIGIGTVYPMTKLDVSGTVNATAYTGTTITTLSNIGAYGSNTSISLSNYIYTTSSTNISTAQTTADWSSNTGLFGSNTSVSASNTTISLSNYVYGTNTTNITNAQTTANWSSNTGLFGSNTSVSASNTTISLSNYVYGTNTTNITNVQTTANWASNAGLYGSNTAVSASNTTISLSNYTYGTNTTNITNAQTTANWSSNTGLFGSNTSVSASNTTISLSNYTYGTNTANITNAQTTANWASNAGLYGSNTAVSASNTTISLSNYTYGTNTTNITNAQTTGDWASNVGLYGSNTSVWASNNLLSKSGGIMTNFLRIDSSNGLALISSSGTGGAFVSLNQGQAMYNNDSNWPYYGIGCSVSGQVNIHGYYGVSIGTQNTTSLTIPTGGNVGIGTTTPAYKFDVSGTARIKGPYTNGACNLLVLENSSSTARIRFVDEFGAQPCGIASYGTLNGLGVYAGCNIGFYTSNASSSNAPLRMVVTAAGNVGIGTNAPTEELHVSSKIFVESQVLASSNDSVSIPGFSFREDSNTGIFHPSNDALAFTTGGVEQMRIMHNGNVGIGLSNPSYRLDVSGNSRFLSSTTLNGYQASRALNVIGTNAVMRIWRPDGDPSVELISGTNSNDGLLSGNVIWDFYTSQGKFMIRDRTPTAGNGVQRLVLDDIGNVGIGTINPIEKIHVASGKIYSDTQLLGTSNDSVSVPSYSFREDSNTGMFHPSDDSVGFTTGGTERMRIDSNGNIGIGTTSPSYSLDVTGTTNLNGNVSMLSNALSFGSTTREMINLYSTTFGIGIQNVNMYSRSGGSFAWFKGGTYAFNQYDAGAGGTVQMVLDANGNLGLGTTSPLSRLHNAGTTLLSGASKIVIQNGVDGGSNSGICYWTANDSNWISYMAASGALKSYVRGTATAGRGFTAHAIRFRAYNTTNNGFIFENSSEGCAASIRADGLSYFAGNTTLNNGFIGDYSGNSNLMQFSHVAYSNNSSGYTLLQDAAGPTYLNCLNGASIRFREGNADKAIITGGNMGIGTTSPSYALHVVGSIYATGDIIGFSDKRLKSNITIIDSALGKIHRLNGYTFNIQQDDKVHTGLIAQEVLEVLPEAVYQERKKDGTDGYYSIAYGNMAGIIVEAIKELDGKYKSQIEDLKQQLVELKNEIQILKQ
jgi:hypothetical protein